MGEDLIAKAKSIRYGDVTDFSSFGGALIDQRAFNRNADAIERANAIPSLTIVAGGGADDREGYFVAPTILLGDDPTDDAFRTEYFGPILAVHVYDDAVPGALKRVLEIIDRGSGYALTGSIIADDRTAIAQATEGLRFAAGNLYINDKPTGAVVGQQPFGGARASGTNDKAGSRQNLLAWVSGRAIKETFVPPLDHLYPHQAPHRGRSDGDARVWAVVPAG
jgi:1-pyrroline-5-carboxylate dehydrogenase